MLAKADIIILGLHLSNLPFRGTVYDINIKCWVAL